MVITIFKVVATLILIVTAYRVATRPFRVAKIDYELHQGYATDRWGEPPDLSKPAAGELWRLEQVSRDDRVTILFCVATIPALIWMGRRLVRIRHSKTNIILAALIPLPLLVSGCSNSNPALSVPDAKSITIVCFYKNQELTDISKLRAEVTSITGLPSPPVR